MKRFLNLIGAHLKTAHLRMPASQTLLEMTAEEAKLSLEPPIQTFLANKPDPQELQAALISFRECAVDLITEKNRLQLTHNIQPSKALDEHGERVSGLVEEVKAIVARFEDRVREELREQTLLDYPERNRDAAREVFIEQEQWISSESSRRREEAEFARQAQLAFEDAERRGASTEADILRGQIKKLAADWENAGENLFGHSKYVEDKKAEFEQRLKKLRTDENGA